MAQRKQIQLVSTRMRVPSLVLLSGISIRRCYELWRRLQTWLRSCIAMAGYRLAAAAPIRTQPWELPYAVGVALKSKEKKKGNAFFIHSLSEQPLQGQHHSGCSPGSSQSGA